EEADHVNAFLKHAGGELLRFGGVADHDRDDRMNTGLDRETARRHRFAKVFCVFFEFVAQLGRCAQNFERFQTRRDNRWRDGVGKEIWTRALPQKMENLFESAGEDAAGAAERFAAR